MNNERINILYQKFNNMCYIQEYNSFGNLCINVKNINITEIKPIFDEFTEYALYMCRKCLEMSKNLNNPQICVHIYLDGCSKKNFSLTLFKKLNSILMKGTGDNVLNTLYIYNKNPVANTFIKLVKQILDKDVRRKIKIVN